MKAKKHHLIPCESGINVGMNGHSCFECHVNGIRILSNNDVLGDKWYIDNGRGEGWETVWYPSPTAAAIAYYDNHN